MAAAAKSVEDLFAEMEEIRKQLDTKKPEIITDIKRKIELFGIQPDELFTTYYPPADKTATAQSAKPVVKAKYRSPDGKTWSGRGKAPLWMLDDKNNRREEYAIPEGE